MIWNPVPRAAKAASSIGYQSQLCPSFLFFTVAAQGSTKPSLLSRKHSLTKRHEPLPPLCQNKGPLGKLKDLVLVRGWGVNFRTAVQLLQNIWGMSQNEGEQGMTQYVWHPAPWDPFYYSCRMERKRSVSNVRFIHGFHLSTWQKKFSFLYIVYFRSKKGYLLYIWKTIHLHDWLINVPESGP